MTSTTFQSQDNSGIFNPHERLNYVLGQVLGVKEFQQEQIYFLNKSQEQNRELHGYGVVKGLEVKCEQRAGGWIIEVSPGFAIDQQGREIRVGEKQCADLNKWLNEASFNLQSHESNASPNWKGLGALEGEMIDNLNGDKVLYVTLGFTEYKTGNQLILGEPSRTELDRIQATRIGDYFELKLSPILPQQHEEDHVRRLGELLERIKIDSDLSQPKIDNQEGRQDFTKEAFIKAICDEIDDIVGNSGKQFIVPKEMAYDVFREALQHWVAHARQVSNEFYAHKRLLQDKIQLFSNEEKIASFNQLKQILAASNEVSNETNSELENLHGMLAKIEIESNATILSEDDISGLKVNVSQARNNPDHLQSLNNQTIPKVQAARILTAIIRAWGDIDNLPNDLQEPMNALILDENAVVLDSENLERWSQVLRNRQQLYIRTGRLEILHDLPDFKASDQGIFRQIISGIENLPVQDDCILLARIQFKLSQLGTDSTQVKVLGTPIVDMLQRPYLLHTRLLQELIKRQGQSVDQLLVRTDEIFSKEGRVGIGTEDPETKLHVKVDNPVSTEIDESSRIRLESKDGTKKLDLRADSTELGLQTKTNNLHIRSTGENKHILMNSLSKDGRVGIGTEAPEAKLHVKGDQIRLDGNVDIRGNLRVEGKLHAQQAHLIQPSDLIALDEGWTERLTHLNGHPAFKFEAGESASFSLLRPRRDSSEGPPTAHLRLYCTSLPERTSDRIESALVTWEIRRQWVASMDQTLIERIPRNFDSAPVRLTPLNQIINPTQLDMNVAYQASSPLVSCSKLITIEPPENDQPADYLIINLKLNNTTNSVRTVYLLIAEVRL